MKAAWQGRMLQAAARYGEAAPTATACCNACRTCATTNLATLALGVTAAAGAGIARFARRHAFFRSSAGKAGTSALPRFGTGEAGTCALLPAPSSLRRSGSVEPTPSG